MIPDRNKVNYFTGDPIDKIVAEGTISIVNDGVTSNDIQAAKIVESVIANPYGKKCLCRFVYSIDGGASYNGQDSHVIYAYTVTSVPPQVPYPTQTLGGLRAAMSVGVDANNITFRTANGYHSNVTDNGAYSYTCFSQTFMVKYTLFEAE